MPADALATSFPAFCTAARDLAPVAALGLGSGMNEAARDVERFCSIRFEAIPGFTCPTVPGHPGLLSVARWADRSILLFEGRLHYFEGHSWDAVTLPVRIASDLGVKVLVLTNAAGGIRDDLAPGSLMVIRDHVEWTRPRCWQSATGNRNDSSYSKELRSLLFHSAKADGISLTEGMYAAVTGPCYETPAEIQALRVWGVDAVGMSTAREIQAGYELGLQCAGISLITNRAAGLSNRPIHHGEVLETARLAVGRLAGLLKQFIVVIGT